VVGDPVLALADPPDLGPRHEEGQLGLNLAKPDGMWGGDPELVLQKVTAFAQRLADAGWRTRVVPFHVRDLDFARRACEEIGSSASLFTKLADHNRLFDTIRGCDVFVGLKLHSVVVASSLYVPSVMLEYRPKCRDFQRSLGREEFTMRTDAIDTNRLTEWVFDLAKNRSWHSAAILKAVQSLRSRLHSSARAVDELLSPKR
jgi:polysaccharide pyruvyl transferase WcaK-like protein